MKKKKDAARDMTAGERLCDALDISPDLLSGGCTLEIRGRSEAVIGGLRRIKIFNENEIRLEMKDFDILICGSELLCPAFGNKKLLVSGVIKSISFEKKED